MPEPTAAVNNPVQPPGFTDEERVARRCQGTCARPPSCQGQVEINILSATPSWTALAACLTRGPPFAVPPLVFLLFLAHCPVITGNIQSSPGTSEARTKLRFWCIPFQKKEEAAFNLATI